MVKRNFGRERERENITLQQVKLGLTAEKSDHIRNWKPKGWKQH